MVQPPSNGDDPSPSQLLRDDRATEALLLLPTALERLDLLPPALDAGPDGGWKRRPTCRETRAAAAFVLPPAPARTLLVPADLPHEDNIGTRSCFINLPVLASLSPGDM
jgi:hypothetical protein